MSDPVALSHAKFPRRRSDFPSPYALWIFAMAARHENLTVTGAEIGLTQGAISHQIKELEASLGFSVFERAGKRIKLNSHGKRLYPIVRGCYADMFEAILAIRRETRQQANALTISTTSFFASRWLSPRLVGFMSATPGVTVQIIHEAVESNMSDAADVEIRWGRGTWQDVRCDLLFETPMTPACSPSLLPADAAELGVSVFDGLMFLGNHTTRESWNAWIAEYYGDARPGIIEGPLIHDSSVRTQAAIDGQGFIMTNQLVNTEIESGRLVIPFEQDLMGHGYYVAVKTTKKSPTPIIAAFIDWINLEVKANPLKEIARHPFAA